jgi:2-polyprenyl-6-methoxyphenol hydroxylase-like FAD-dependent oxidoreductase
MSTEIDFDAVVFGAGPVGAAVALGLQQHGYRVCVREKRSEHDVIGDAGKSINLSLSTRGVALLTELNVYEGLKTTLVPMVSRRFSNGSTEKYREPLQSINRNLLTIKLIEAAQRAGVTFVYDVPFTRSMINAETGEVSLQAKEGGADKFVVIKPRIIIGCDGVHGKVGKTINPHEPERSSRQSEWGYYELTLPASATASMGSEQFENFHIWPGKAPYKNEFIVGLPNSDGTITLTLFGLCADVNGRMHTEAEMKTYLAAAFDGALDTCVEGIADAVAGGFRAIFLNDHENLAGQLGNSGAYVFLFGDAALGMEQFLGLAVNAGFEGAHRFLQHFHRGGDKKDDFWRSLCVARNALNSGVKALQQASHKNAASMRDGCDDPLGKAVRAVLEGTFGSSNIDHSAFESTHDWWSFSETPLKVIEAVVAAQDEIVDTIKASIAQSRGGDNTVFESATAAAAAELTEEEKALIVRMAAPKVDRLVADKAEWLAAHHAKVNSSFN